MKLLTAALILLLSCGRSSAQPVNEPQSATQPPAATAPPAAAAPAALALEVERTAESATLSYFNRSIVTVRARVMGRTPAERVAIGVRTLDNLVAARRTSPVNSREVPGGFLIGVGDAVVIGLTSDDLDETSGETLENAVAQTIGRMQQALNEADEVHQSDMWVRGLLWSVAAIVLGVTVLWLLGRLRRYIGNTLSAFANRTVARTGLADQQAARAFRLLDHLLTQLASIIIFAFQLVVLYLFVAFILRQFPYTRPWGESLRAILFTIFGGILTATEDAIPGLLTVAVIIVITRVVIGLSQPWFEAVEQGMVEVEWMHPETVATTRRLFTLGLWLFAAAMAYPYIPGSDTEAFKGISVFVGLMVTLGSSGLVSQVTSGIMLTYSRALRLGDYVKVGDVEGTIINLGMLSTKVRTLKSEEVTIPNAVIVGQTTTDYSRYADVVRTTTSVTIGYDVPWRQVHALLMEAAARTSGIRNEPSPRVFQSELDQNAVRYTLSFVLDHQEARVITMSALHAQVQDLFNEHGVQIMVPSYEGDPESPKVVAKQDWYMSPAAPERAEKA